jgi:hypothetical protein
MLNREGISAPLGRSGCQIGLWTTLLEGADFDWSMLPLDVADLRLGAWGCLQQCQSRTHQAL